MLKADSDAMVEIAITSTSLAILETIEYFSDEAFHQASISKFLFFSKSFNKYLSRSDLLLTLFHFQ